MDKLINLARATFSFIYKDRLSVEQNGVTESNCLSNLKVRLNLLWKKKYFTETQQIMESLRLEAALDIVSSKGQ